MRLKFSFLSDMMEMVITLLTDLIDMCGHTEIKIKPRSLIQHSSGRHWHLDIADQRRSNLILSNCGLVPTRMISVLSEFNWFHPVYLASSRRQCY